MNRICILKKNSLEHIEGLICFCRHLEKQHHLNNSFIYVFGMLMYIMQFSIMSTV